MGWNEPSNKNKGKDPWGNRGNDEGPPDISKIIRKIQQSLRNLFGKKPSGGGTSAVIIIIVIIVTVIGVALKDMVYFVDTQERGVLLRLGAYTKTWQPGLNIRLPKPIDEVLMVNVERVRAFTHKAAMLTQDENIVDVEVAVQWKIRDPAKYMFSVNSQQLTLKQVTESAVREVIGKSKLDYVLTEGRAEITQSQMELIQQTLDDYRIGILVQTVEMQPAKPPEEVKEAFDDAIKAREDEQRLINESEAYRNDIIPKARGAAARLREEANGYKSRVIAKAEGEASRFNQLLMEYERAPAVTRQRLYLDAIESVLSNTNKVLLDAEGNNSIMYLPIDRLIENSRNNQKAINQSTNTSGEVNSETTSQREPRDDRDRLGSRTRMVR